MGFLSSDPKVTRGGGCRSEWSEDRELGLGTVLTSPEWSRSTQVTGGSDAGAIS